MKVDEYLILDVFGELFFYPGWTTDVDFQPRTFAPGEHAVDKIFDFMWPNVEGSVSGLRFYLGFLDPTTYTLVGSIDMVEFGYR